MSKNIGKKVEKAMVCMDKGIIIIRGRRRNLRGHRTEGLNEVKEQGRWENESRGLERQWGVVKR